MIYLYKNEDYVLPGLKSLSDIQFDIIEEENRLDESVIETTNNENIIPTIHQYSGTPKTKTAPSFIKGRKIYSRNPQTAINALALANYKCEIDEIHPTFIRRKMVNHIQSHITLFPWLFLIDLMYL